MKTELVALVCVVAAILPFGFLQAVDSEKDDFDFDSNILTSEEVERIRYHPEFQRNDISLYLTVRQFEAMRTDKILFYEKSEPSTKVAGGTVRVIYTYMGSGIIDEFAMAYFCHDDFGRCDLIAAFRLPSGNGALSHSFSEDMSEVRFQNEDGILMTAKLTLRN